ncbi:MAG: hypothetical protein HC940_11065 [Acaryochloris sp. SU_5_25]|nr:hypothetical protein [Acaryochloris sp. SU_5_25]
MSQVNYTTMSDEELRQHFLRHRDDKRALRTYLDRLSERPREIITTVDDPDFDAKIQAVVLRKMQAESPNNDVGD